MPGRTTPLINGNFYHIFNRGNDKRDIFKGHNDYQRFIKTIFYYHFQDVRVKFSIFNKSRINLITPITDSKLVDIICYCLMPNHFHLLIRQRQSNGISAFLGNISNSYTKYFNAKYKRSGSLLQGTFKSVAIESDEQLIHVSRYVHLNPIVSRICPNINLYKWSSYHEYKYGQRFCEVSEILSFFNSTSTYESFLEDQIDYGQSLEFIKHHLLDDD